MYLAHLASLVRGDGEARFKPSSIARKVAAIAAVHRDAGYASPTADDRVRRVMAGIRRSGDATVRRMRPVFTDDVRGIVEAMPHHVWPAGVKAARDAAAFLIGFGAALRRSSIVSLDVADLQLVDYGLEVRLRRSKTDQAGVGATLPVPTGTHVATCAACAWVRWSRILGALERGTDPLALVVTTPPAAEWDVRGHWCTTSVPGKPTSSAPAFRPLTASGSVLDRRLSGDAIYRAVKTRSQSVDLNPMLYGAHSLRAGFVTQARRNGASRRQVRLQAQLANDSMIDVYDREYNPLAGGNAVTMLGL